MRSIVTDEVAWFVCRSVCLSVTIVSPAKTAEPIEMPCGVAKSSELKEACIRWRSRFPVRRGNLEERGKGWPIIKYGYSLPWAVSKRLNRSRCRLGDGLGWTQGTIFRWDAHWYNLMNTIEPAMRGGVAALSNYFDHLLWMIRFFFHFQGQLWRPISNTAVHRIPITCITVQPSNQWSVNKTEALRLQQHQFMHFVLCLSVETVNVSNYLSGATRGHMSPIAISP